MLNSPSSYQSVPFMLPIFPGLGCTKANCPLYCPVVPDSICRICGLTALQHRNYYIYSYFAMKIQIAYIKYSYRLFLLRNEFLLKKSVTPYFLIKIRLYYKYYRKWHKIMLNNNCKQLL